MQTTLHKSHSRGHADHGWLNSHHSFSFAGYHNPDRVHFGMLRVLNDDTVQGGKGFGSHPHDNMEIISIPLGGALEHRDSIGTVGVIGPNDVQVMSAGKGVVHSEYNHSKVEEVRFLQIWIFPKVRHLAPRYDQRTFEAASRVNQLQRLVSPIEDGTDSLKINQDAYLSRVSLNVDTSIEYTVNKIGNGVYVFVIDGHVEVSRMQLHRRDALAVSDASTFAAKALSPADVLFIEVPMS